MLYLDGIREGDRLWDSLADEWLRVARVDDNGDYPVRFAMGHGCTMDGCQWIPDKNPRYLWDRVEITPPPRPKRVIRKTGWAVVNTRPLHDTFDQAEKAAGGDNFCKPLWCDDNTEEEMQKFHKEEIIYNLMEDIQCLREAKETAELKVMFRKCFSAEYLEFIRKKISNDDITELLFMVFCHGVNATQLISVD